MVDRTQGEVNTSAARPGAKDAEVPAEGGRHEGGKEANEEEKPPFNGLSLGAA